ncbi:MAG: hypothetical protein JOY57_02770 [Actinobacteria bacterium]|nr:hypothetical protein [Actinomycetota bacterium]
MAAIVAAVVLGVLAFVAARGRRYDRRAERERLEVFAAHDGKRLTLNLDSGGRVNFISSVTGTVTADAKGRAVVILHEGGDKEETVPLGRIRAIFRGEHCLGSW